MELALKAARRFLGATNPNPPVGAAGMDSSGNILAVKAHERAGEPHAEINVIRAFAGAGELSDLHTLVVTLEPCNHTGRTGPCTEAILATSIKRVVFGARDPNPNVNGGGADRLRAAGIEVIEGVMEQECQELIRGFTSRVNRGRPWLTIKRALRHDGSMIPPLGSKTFTSRDGLRFAHELRRRSDAILTGSGTILADAPLLNVRHVEDHPGKQRQLALFDRRQRVSAEWKKAAAERGFEILEADNFSETLASLAQAGVQEALVEAGPELSSAWIESNQWDEIVDIFEGEPLRVRRTLNPRSEA
jgi:diaminohydroxyphosphoribosylaminopyrimidine deaminase/5-amino-6-(5-phosphoribosylamino)uracil reductase